MVVIVETTGDSINSGASQEIQMSAENHSSSTGDLQNIQLAYRLNGINYLKWSLLVRTFLKGRGKINHLLGTGPKEGDPKYASWDEQDSLVMTWLWSSMLSEISDTVMFFVTSHEIWEAIKQTYSKVKDAVQIYEIKTKVSSTKQGSKTVTKYSILLKNLWQEMDHYQNLQMNCREDTQTLIRFIEKERIDDFLAGLNLEYDAVRVQILGKEELPSLNEAIAIIRSEEGRRGVMVDNTQAESSTLVTKILVEERISDNKSEGIKISVWCTYCKKPNHMKDKCWKLHGRPQTANRGFNDGSGRRQGRAYASKHPIAEDSQEPVEFNKEEIEKLKNLLGSLEKQSSSGTCNLVFSGITSQISSSNAFDLPTWNSWVIDSGATDHVTNSCLGFVDYKPCSSNQKITVADGTKITVAGIGNIPISETLTLKNVLHIPKLFTISPFRNSPKTQIVVLSFMLLNVYFRNKRRGG
ncbi:hypothetical protein V6N12_062273 [Hibiscus sabdariffa]|uniref:Retrovirus-related Pol polyprotein from transposon TNT 1-94-like beta-barrel domain-containing protein n=1 Tax=Hibiscus sabdariffa TaxID=183260 RepID=A0ABR2F8D1_9ROSI